MGKIKASLFQSIKIVIISASLGLIFNWTSPAMLSLIPRYIPLKDDPRIIEIEDAKKFFDKAISVFIDARKKEDYVKGHIPGAMNYYAEEFGTEDEESITQFLPFDTIIITYCDGGECELSRRLAERLGEIGYTKVRILVVGWDGWKKAGYPIER